MKMRFKPRCSHSDYPRPNNLRALNRLNMIHPVFDVTDELPAE